MKANDLKLSESKKLILATYQMAAEALDIKSLTTLILATPKTDIVQASGRILREKHENPLIIDIVDSHDVFKRQFEKRKKFYLDQKYTVIKTDFDKYINNDFKDCSKWESIEKNTKKNRQKSIECFIDIKIN